jgi:hypothetical protein
MAGVVAPHAVDLGVQREKELHLLEMVARNLMEPLWEVVTAIQVVPVWQSKGLFLWRPIICGRSSFNESHIISSFRLVGLTRTTSYIGGGSFTLWPLFCGVTLHPHGASRGYLPSPRPSDWTTSPEW